MARKAKLPPGMVQRGTTYYAEFQHKGERYRKRLSTDFAAAKILLNQLKADADLSENGPRHNRYSWAELKKSFLLWARQHVKRWKEYERDLSNFERFGMIVSCHQVTAEHVYKYRTWRLEEGVSIRTVNKEVSTVKNMLSKGVKRFHVLAANPIAEVAPLADLAPRKVRRALSATEVEAIFAHSPPDLLPPFVSWRRRGFAAGNW